MSLRGVFRGGAFFCFLMWAGVALQAAVVSVPLADGANRSFSDDVPDDRMGGWVDLGGNDLHVLSPGALTAAGVPFQILDGQSSTGLSCVVLGRGVRSYLPADARVPVDGRAGAYLYLLHAAAWCPSAQAQKTTGVLTVEYGDGSASEFPVRFGVDVGAWTAADSYANAARAWTAYNGTTQVSLFVSRFSLGKKPVKALRFAARESAWMIAAVSMGDEVAVKPLRPDVRLDRTYVAPPPFTAPLPDFPATAIPKNIVLVIGDGMGAGAQHLASLYQHHETGRLVLEQLPVAGLCLTQSASSDITDSAAAATAIATGQKTNNGMLGMTPSKRRLTSIAEAAHRSGRAVGLITSDAIIGATPAGFYAHQPGRSAYTDVASDASVCGFDILIGDGDAKACRACFLPQTAAGARMDGRNLLTDMGMNGYDVVDTQDAFDRVPSERRVIGFMKKGTLDAETCLAGLTATALRRLAKNEKGFFLMVECTITDNGGHGNDPELSVRGVLQVDWAVRQAVDFARGRDDTLVLVTADHETGGVYAVRGGTASSRLVFRYTSVGHTGAPVPVYAFGPGSLAVNGVIDNTQLATTFFRFWQLTP